MDNLQSYSQKLQSTSQQKEGKTFVDMDGAETTWTPASIDSILKKDWARQHDTGSQITNKEARNMMFGKGPGGFYYGRRFGYEQYK